MRVALLSPDLAVNGSSVAGHVIATYQMIKVLEKRLGDDFKTFVFSGTGRPLGIHPSDVRLDCLHYNNISEGRKRLKEFNPDVMIISPADTRESTKGDPSQFFYWEWMLDLGIPYCTYLHAETELSFMSIYRYRMLDPYFRGILVSGEGFKYSLDNFFGFDISKQKKIEFARFYELNMIEPDMSKKNKLLAFHSRMYANPGATNLLMNLIPYLKEAGFKVRCAGAHVKWGSAAVFIDKFKDDPDVEILGHYVRDDLPKILGDALFHWYVFEPYGGSNKEYRNQETTSTSNCTIEAIQHGCISMRTDDGYLPEGFVHKVNCLGYNTWSGNFTYEQIVEDMEYYWNHKDEAYKIAKAGQEQLLKHLDEDKHYNVLMNYLESLL